MSVIITGASGCVGRQVLKEIPKGWGKVYAVYNKSTDFRRFIKANSLKGRVEAVKCDLTDSRQVDKVFKGKRFFRYCIFLAASISVAKSVQDPIFDLRTNVASLIYLLSKIRVKRLIYMSSTSVYDGLKGKVGPDSVLKPAVPYGISKLTSEHYVRFFTKRLKTVSEYVIFRLSGAYGPYSPPKKMYNRIIKDFYFDKKNEITLFGDGRNLIDLLCVSEIARAIKLALRSKKANYTLDLCSGNIMMLKELVRKGALIFGIKNLRIKHVPFPETEKYMTYQISPHRTRKILGFANRVSYEEGLTNLAKFYEREELEEWQRK